jgi:hypothetical protein
VKTIERIFGEAKNYMAIEKEEIVKQHIIKKMHIIEDLKYQLQDIQERIEKEEAELENWRTSPTKLMQDLLRKLPRMKDGADGAGETDAGM